MHYILCKDDNWTSILKKELTADFTKDCYVLKGFPLIKLPAETNLKDGYIAFSSTALIDAALVPDNSVSKQAAEIMADLSSKIEPGSKINCHVFGLTEKYGILETGRAEIISGKVTQALKKKNIHCPRKGFDRTLGFLQILILPNRSVAVSFIKKEDLASYQSLISPFAGGFSNVGDDLKAPSRAFKKLIEAQEVMGIKISETDIVVDLGACPGGWTYVARKSGAKVIALDRSPLAKELMEDKLVIFKKEDAFKFEVKEPVDWVVSDIVCAPERILELINYWAVEKKCKNFVFTIKFKGHQDYGLLKKFKNIAKEVDYNVILKQLNVNKNEVTIMGTQH